MLLGLGNLVSFILYINNYKKAHFLDGFKGSGTSCPYVHTKFFDWTAKNAFPQKSPKEGYSYPILIN